MHQAASAFRQVPWQIRDVLIGVAVLLPWAALPYFDRSWYAPLPMWVYWLLYVVPCLAWPLLFPLWVARRRSATPLFTNRGLQRVLKEAGIAFLVYLAMISLMCGLMALAFGFLGEEALPHQRLPERLGPAGLPVWFAYAAVAVAVAPIAEEIFFRGFLYNAFRLHMPHAVALVLQALLFAFFHPYGVSYAGLVFFMGLVFALVYEWRQTLLAPIIVHALQNLLVFTVATITIISNANAPYLGVNGKPDDQGCLITQVYPGTAAEDAELREGDILSEFDGQPVRSVEDLKQLVNQKQFGDEVRLVVIRNDTEFTMTVTLRRRE